MNQEQHKGTTDAAAAGQDKAISRRHVLRTLGIGGAMLAGSAFASKLAMADAPPSNAEKAGRVLQVASVAELTSMPPGLLKDGQHVVVNGYNNSGDGGGKLVRWNAASTKADNGGTVHSVNGMSGRFEVVHNGVADFRWFGVFGSTQNADAALDAMAGDLTIHRIEAHSDLNFTKRH
ncbi:MAG: peptidase, partial [Paenibacillus sp.]|nr:peptidase [Paenibacillus sp.]